MMMMVVTSSSFHPSSDPSPVHRRERERGMAAVAGAGGGGGDEMLVLLRPRRQRIALSDLTNLSSATSVITRLKAKGKARTERKRSPASSIGSSTNPRIPMHPPPPPPPSAQAHGHVAGIKGKDKATRELQTSGAHLNKMQNISKPKVKTGGVLPGLSFPPSINTRKITRKEQPLYAPSKRKAKTDGDVLPAASTPPSKKTMRITRKEQVHMETEPLISPLYASSKTTRKVTSSSREEEEQAEIMDDEMSWDEGPSEEFIEERRAYFAEVDAFELVEEFVSSGSDAE